MNAALMVAVPEAAKRTSEGGKAGPIGLAVILILCIACYFLFKSMSKHLKKVRDEFPSEAPTGVRTTPAAPAARVVLVKAKHEGRPSTGAGAVGDPPAAGPVAEDPGHGSTQTSD